MREIVLGTAGHVDHGKTSFVRALTGIETDRLIAELRLRIAQTRSQLPRRAP